MRFPPLFGAYDRTELLVSLYTAGPVRGPTIARAFSENVTDRGYSAERSRIVARTRAPQNRGWVFALNERYFAYRELVALLRVLGKHFEARPLDTDVTPPEAQLVKSALIAVGDGYVLGSSTRTWTFVALEALGGRTTTGILARAVSGQSPTSVKNVIGFLVQNGVLMKRGEVVSFADVPWRRALRKLLAAYLRNYPERRAYARAVQRRYERWLHDPPPQNRWDYRPAALFLSEHSHALLRHFVASGPTIVARALGAAGAMSEKRLRTLIEMGVLCKSVNARGERIVGLNSRYPVHRELVALVCALEGVVPHPKVFAVEKFRPEYEIARLFGPRSRTDALIHVGLAVKGEIDPSMMRDLMPEPPLMGTLAFILNRLEQGGFLKSRWYKTQHLFSLDEDFVAHAELRELLQAIGRRWRDYAACAALERRFADERRLKLERGR